MPSPHRLQLQVRGLTIQVRHNLLELVVASEQAVQRFELSEVIGAERSTLPRHDERPKPLAEFSGLRRDVIELARQCLSPKRLEGLGWHESCLL